MIAVGFVPAHVGAWLTALAEDESMATIASHLSACRDRGCTPATLGSKYSILKRAQRETGGSLVDVAEPDLRRWWRRLVGREPATRAAYLTHLRVFFRWAQREEIRADDPTRRLDGPKVRARLPRPALESAVRDLLERVDGTGDWLPIALSVFAGLRVAEIAAVRPRDVELDADRKPMLRVRGKGGSELVVPIPQQLADRLRELPEDEPAVRGRYGAGYTPDGMSRAIARIMAEHGVAGSAHNLRHLFGTRAHRATKDLLATQRLMRHVSASTTSGYADLDVTALRAASTAVWDDLTASQPPPESHPTERGRGRI